MRSKQLSDLRKQQDEFIIKQLKYKLDKVSSSEEDMHNKLLKAQSEIAELNYTIQQL